MAINNLNPRRTIWYSTHEPSNKYDLWLCPSTATHDANGNPINPKCVYDLKIFECGEWRVINFCHCNGGDDPSHYVPVESLRIDPKPVSLKVGDGRLLSCIITPSNATNQRVTWSIQGSTTDRTIISIDQNGYVTALNTGTATVIATSNDNPNILDTAVVTVTQSSGGNTYTVTTIANPTNGGTVTGGGKYEENAYCTVRAEAKSGFLFSYWKINGVTLSSSRPEKTFLVTKDTTCVAYFTQNATLPTVETTSITNVTRNSALCNGNVTSNGGANITERGFCYGTSLNPSTSGTHVLRRDSGVGTFSAVIDNLLANTTYHVRAYAINSVGTSYGTDMTFTTSSNTVPSVLTYEPYEPTLNSATSGGDVLDDGGSNVTARGICWSTSQNPTISDQHTEDGTGIGPFTSEMTELSSGTTYYVRAYATNSSGIAYGDLESVTTQEQAGPTELPVVYVGNRREMSMEDFKNLSNLEILNGIQGINSTGTINYSYPNWDGEAFYITYFLVKNSYNINNIRFLSLGQNLGVHWNWGGIEIFIKGNSYLLYANRQQFTRSDKFLIVIE